MLTLILALAIADPASAPETAKPAVASETVVAEGSVTTAKTPAGPHWVCKWRAHPTGIPIRYCGTARDWRDEKINHQQDIEIDQRRLLVSAPY